MTSHYRLFNTELVVPAASIKSRWCKRYFLRPFPPSPFPFPFTFPPFLLGAARWRAQGVKRGSLSGMFIPVLLLSSSRLQRYGDSIGPVIHTWR
ncbi:hypothetical protein E2C01_094440 [Portunus trituberculatus]|uniref:Uncharacterized protein n=1 Tax=Portunus trituberculatus TaxID=210409 RepID=A0A5B7JXL1_PORTR|nr:hypothetical protein [Portunus trituberculatus]